ncbi:MAG: hypothetical protein ACKERG_00175 [Candidatus Hodgkinia cicadicola]
MFPSCWRVGLSAWGPQTEEAVCWLETTLSGLLLPQQQAVGCWRLGGGGKG